LTENTAPDVMGHAARKAAILATTLDFKLLGAASAGLSREERYANAVRAFSQFRALARAMSALEEAAPNAAREGYADNERAQEIIEGRARG
jgi:hypothetical protein